jgi:hypothetical protein
MCTVFHSACVKVTCHCLPVTFAIGTLGIHQVWSGHEPSVKLLHLFCPFPRFSGVTAYLPFGIGPIGSKFEAVEQLRLLCPCAFAGQSSGIQQATTPCRQSVTRRAFSIAIAAINCERNRNERSIADAKEPRSEKQDAFITKKLSEAIDSNGRHEELQRNRTQTHSGFIIHQPLRAPSGRSWRVTEPN